MSAPVGKRGFLAGYKTGPRGRTPNPPAKLSAANRSVWLEAWAEGSTLARRHQAELIAAVQKITGMKEPTP